MSRYKYTIILKSGVELIEYKDYGILSYMEYLERNDKYYALYNQNTKTQMIIDKNNIDYILINEI